jgi:hypothetical protein
LAQINRLVNNLPVFASRYYRRHFIRIAIGYDIFSILAEANIRRVYEFEQALPET